MKTLHAVAWVELKYLMTELPLVLRLSFYFLSLMVEPLPVLGCLSNVYQREEIMGSDIPHFRPAS